MHPLSSQPGFKAPIINGNTVEIEADASTPDVYETPCAQGLLLQNDLYLIETSLRSDRPRRCELYDLRAEPPSLALNVLDMRFRCTICDEYAQRVKEHDRYPKFVMSNEECSFKEICKMRCGCAAAPNELLAEVTLVALQTRGTHLYHQYALTLPAGASYRVEHVLSLPTTDIRQNQNEIKVQSTSYRVQQLTLFFERTAISLLYKLPLSMSAKGVNLRGNELRNSFDVRNDTAGDLVLEWDATSTHMFDTTFTESVRYFQFIHNKTYESSSMDLFDEHKSYWLSTCISIQYEPKGHMSSNDQAQFQELRLLTQVSTFESMMLRHNIDEDDMTSVPVLIVTRPNNAKTILNHRINQIDQQIARYMGLEGGVARWREKDDLFWTRSSANRIYRNALLIIHIWQYFQHTRDYTWLESVGYPGIYKSAMFIVEFRHVDPGSSVIRFKNVQNVHGVTVENDLFTNRICMIALKYASTAAWKLNFKHQLIWEEYNRIESGVQDVDTFVFDATDKRLWVNVEFIHGTATCVFFWLEQVEGKTLFHRIGHRFGAKYGKYILLNNTRLIQSQLIKTSYLIEIRAQDNSLLFSTETDASESWDISQASSYNFQWRNNFFGITRAEVSHSFGENAFVRTSPGGTIDKIPSEDINSHVAFTMSTPYMTMLDYEYNTHMVDTLEIALDDLTFQNPEGLGMISSKFMHIKHMQFIEQWKSIRFFTQSLLNSKLSSKTASFMLLFGMLCIEFRGSTNKFASTEETYLTECFNQGILPPFVNKIVVQNLSSLPPIEIRNNLFKTSLRRFPKDKTLYVLTYLPETPESSLAYTVEINSFAMKLDIDPVYDSSNTFNPVTSVVKGRNYGVEHPLFASLTNTVSATIEAETYTLTAVLYDHEYALTDPLPNALGTLSYNFDATDGNYLSWRVSLDTFDQNRYVVVNRIVLRLEFREIFSQMRIEIDGGTTEDVDLTGSTHTTVDKTLSNVSGSEVDIMTLRFLVLPNKEYLLQNHPPFSGLYVELSHNGSTVFKYTNSKTPLFDQTHPPFVSYAQELPVLTGRIDSAVYFDPAQVPASAGSVTVQEWYKVRLFEQSHQLVSLSPGPEITQLASNQLQTLRTYTIRLNAGAITMSKTDGYQFERDFGSTYEHVILEINKRLVTHTPRWIRGFRTHIIMGTDDDGVYAIGTNVNFHRTTKVRHIVLTEMTELQTLRNYITATQKIHDVQEGELGDSLKFQIRSGQNTFWWGIGTNYHNTLGVSQYDPLIVDNVLNNIRNVHNELVYLDMLNKKLSDHYHKRLLVAPLREGRNDEILIYDKIERTVDVLGGRSDKTRWTSVPLAPLLGTQIVRYVLYDNVEKALLLGTSSPS